MTQPYPYISVGDLTIFMNASAGSLNSGPAALAVAAAMQSVRKHLDQAIVYYSGDVVALDGTAKDTIRLPERPVWSVASVVEDGATLATDMYLVRNSLIIRKDGATFNLGRGNIVVTYSHGWYVETITDSDFVSSAPDVVAGAEPIPADIILATLSAARRSYTAAGSADTGGLTGETIGNYSWQGRAIQGAELVDAEKNVLAPYRVSSGRNTGTR